MVHTRNAKQTQTADETEEERRARLEYREEEGDQLVRNEGETDEEYDARVVAHMAGAGQPNQEATDAAAAKARAAANAQAAKDAEAAKAAKETEQTKASENAKAGPSGTKRPAEADSPNTPLDLYTDARERPPAPFLPKNFIKADNINVNFEPTLLLWDFRFPTVQRWWREIVKDQKAWLKNKKKSNKPWPTPNLNAPGMKAIRCETGCFFLVPQNTKTKKYDVHKLLHARVVEEQDLEVLPYPPPQAEWLRATKLTPTGEMNTARVNGFFKNYQGGWRVACPTCLLKYSGANGPPEYRVGNDERQIPLTDGLDDEVIEERELQMCVTYSGVAICRAAIPLSPDSAFTSCGRCKPHGYPCKDDGGAEWTFSPQDPEVEPSLRLAKILMEFVGGKATKKAERQELFAMSVKILRDEICHRRQSVAIDDADNSHDAGPSEAFRKLFTSLLEDKKLCGGKEDEDEDESEVEVEDEVEEEPEANAKGKQRAVPKKKKTTK
ncbi:hypothetical protein HD553DRAFT_324433 [Filobasidium floriforme]|uniref:uncharacterized protein n=1 Tax=Filobasidium floriforme TaxID=5210 RepID=UPI001E8DD85D|nr:uncharacterized protein HD553DRAFT_324433 [Filobasidium floriforme]KAH8083521.1 hypothetical protein HD553DRAFT_324433 [Filobasidium floriforme]